VPKGVHSTEAMWVRSRWGILVLLTAATVLPHAAICAYWWPLTAVLKMGVVTEAAHVAVHALLFGLLAAALSAWIVRASDGPRLPGVRGRALVALAYFVVVAGLRQAVQLGLRGAHPGAEEVFELSLDGVAGALGAVGWALADPAGARRIAGALGWVFHPAIVAPLGFFALCWSRTGSAATAARWTALVGLFELPALAVWLLGVRQARFSDADVSKRHERPPLLAFGVLCAAGLLIGTVVLDAPRIVVSSAVAAIVGAAAATAITRWGLKLSGHVAVAAGAAFALLPDAPRGALVFATMAVILVWARVRAERHNPREVLAGFVLAAVVASVSIHSLG
jgi:hypothetical protein